MKVKNVVEALKKFGIRAQAYAKPPVTKDVFVLSILPKGNEGTIAIHQGAADVDVHGSKTERQAVLRVREKGRAITRKVKTVRYQTDRPNTERAEQSLKSAFPITMPMEGTKWSYSDIKIEEIHKAPTLSVTTSSKAWRITGTVTASVGKTTTNNFLLGVDESHNFIAPLPRAAKSVHDAHMLLKPKGMRAGSLRQGEWFFEPCTKEECARFDQMVNEKGDRVQQIELGQTTHMVKSGMRVDHVIYAVGFVTDKRNGRHDSIFLPDWHKVVRNKEIPMPRRRRGEAINRRRSSFD
jgi:hypothetical protein